ncbi:MAG: hypothetical protein LAQ69_07100 [Acidobacteriia bacterium]|nr:hypothetical protein [Terriglobia bacterium]
MALMEHTTIDKAAAACGVSYVTLWRWTQQEEFQRRLHLARRQAFSQAVARLQQASSAAVGTLLRVMTDQAAPAASRVRAADSVLDHAAKAIELEDLDIRLSELERAADQSKDVTE